MKKTITVNIAGLIFNIEEEAYQKLGIYLESIKSNFQNSTERTEIMNDIEARIAELFQESISDRKEVVTLKDVDRIIDIMGQPEDYQTEDDEQQTTSDDTTSEETSTTYKKRVFRDTDNAIIGGVSSGLANYLGTDPVFVRIIFVLMFLMAGSGILLYLVLLFIIPEAKTTAEKLQMKGEKVNIDNIKKHINDLKNDFTEKASSNSKNFKHKVQHSVNKSRNAASGVARVFSTIFGFALTLGGIFGLFIVISLLIGESGLLPLWGDRVSENLTDIMDVLYQTQIQSTTTYFSILAILFIPLIGMITTGIKIIFQIRQNIRPFGIAMTILWFVAIGICALTSIQLGMEFKDESEISERIELPSLHDEIIFLDIAEDDIFSNHVNLDSPFRHSQLINIQADSIHMGTPVLKIIENEQDSTFDITIIKKSRGLSMREAIYKAEHIDYKYSVDSNKVVLSPYLSINKSDKLRSQEVTVLIEIPAGKKIHFGENITRMPPMECSDCYHSEKFINSTWTMRDKKLECLGCDE